MKNSKIKIIILGDGMADVPDDGKTPLAEAKTPVIDALIKSSYVGLVRTVPAGMKPGSDIANLSVMGYDPARYYTGRSPLEAVSIGIEMKDDDLALRCNLVTLGEEHADGGAQSGGFGEKTTLGYGADGISVGEKRADGGAQSGGFGEKTMLGYGADGISVGEKHADGGAQSGGFGEKTMLDYSAGEVSTEEAHILIADFAKHLKSLENSKNRGIVPQKGAENLQKADDSKKTLKNITNDIEKHEKNDGTEPPEGLAAAPECFTFYGGVSYRNCLIIDGGVSGTVCVPPHDISGKKIGGYLPRGVYGESFTEIIEESYKFLSDHEINKKRIGRGQNPANAVWLWGEGKKPLLDDFYELNGKRGAVVSAVDLIKGIGVAANMKIYEVEGATGTVDTNFKGKADAVIRAVSDGYNFIYLHIEAADECGHHGDREGKVRAIEKIDWTVGYIKNELDKKNSKYSFMILPDHPTPISTLTHSSDPVPYMIFDSGKNLSNGVGAYDETAAKEGGFVGSGTVLLKTFLEF